MSKVILFASGKGGAGKSFISCNIGAALAEKGKRVVLLDLDSNFKNLDIYLGLESKAVFNIMDVLDGTCTLRQALLQDKRFGHLYLLPGQSSYNKNTISENQINQLIEVLKKYFDFILIDSPTGQNQIITSLRNSIDVAVLIVEPNIPTLRDSNIFSKYLRDMGVKKIACVLNKVNTKLIVEKLIPSVTEISEELNMEILGMIQYDDNILVSTNFGIPVYSKKESYIAENIDNILERILSL